MDKPLYNVNVYDKNCLGCKRHQKDVMITISTSAIDDTGLEFNDYFLTQAQALDLMGQL